MWEWLWAIVCWAQLSVLEPVVRWWEEVVLGSWEEWLLALVRQGFEETTRFLNGIATWFLQLLSKQRYRDQLQRAWQENSWQQWWGQVATRPSTLNALVANLVAQQQQEQQQERCIGASAAGANSPSVALASGVSDGRATSCESASQSPSAASTGAASGNPPSTSRPGPGQASTSREFARRHTAGRLSAAARSERPMVFVQQSGMGILDELAKRRHGLIEDAKVAAQLTVSRCFEVARSTIRAVLLLPPREAPAAYTGLARHEEAEAPEGPIGSGAPTPGADGTSTLGTPAAQRTPRAPLQRSKSAHVNIAELAYKPGAGAGAASSSMSRRQLRRSHSFGRHYGSIASYQAATEAPSDALSVIRSAGYPHELHMVTTSDGYVLRLERIPRPGARDTVFFMHGVLDTSMAWVSGGVTGSQAFAAWEAGLDVWLGNSRGNAPRQHSDPACRGGRYWRYNINHMGMYDISAQLDHIHNIKCAELGAGSVTLDLDHLGPLAGSFLGGGAGAGLAGSGDSGTPSAVGNAGARGVSGSGLLPDRSVSAAEQPQRYRTPCSAAAPTVRLGGVRSGMRMRNSNSDGNLCRWGSTASGVSAVSAVSAASSGAACGDGLDNGAASGRADRQASVLQQSQLPTLAGLDAVEHGGASGPGAAAGEVMAAPVASSASLCRAGSSLLTPMQSCESGEVGAGEPGQAADQHEGALEAPPTPTPPAIHRNAVTLTVSSACDGEDASSLSGASDVAGRLLASEAHLASGFDHTSATKRPATFTLEAKTRTDFRQPPQDALLPTLSTGPTVANGSAGPSAAAPGSAHSLLGSMGAVLGPAAGAVSAAMASAGVALAGVAASASQLLHTTPPASPLRPAAAGASPHRPDAAGPVGGGPGHAAAGPTTASPFAARPAQLPAAAAEGVAQRAAAAGSSPRHPAMRIVNKPQDASPRLEQSRPVRRSGSATAQAPQPQHQATTATHRGLTLSPPPPAPSSLPGFRRATSTDQLASSAAGVLQAGQATARGRGPLYAASLQHGLTGPARLGIRNALQGFGAGAGVDPGPTATTGSGMGAAGQAFPAMLSEPGAAAAAASGGAGSAAQAALAVAAAAAAPPPPPYKLRCVAHSLGGMSVLIHLVNRLREGRPHHVSRLVLLTPAGFHKYFPKAAKPIAWVLPLLARLLRLILGRSFCFPLYIPTPLGRALTFKLLLSASRIPGLGELMRLGFKAMLDGDVSQWDRALQMPHYNAEDMPAISLDQVLHLVQLAFSDCFRLYDYGSGTANRLHYGVSQPPDVSAEYWRLDMPVHLVAGRRDGIIPPANIRRHLDAMRAQGVPVSYREFDFGHLDFTFGVKEELRIYLMKLLRM
ncbi:hypothetical protein CHLRE_12g541352v5 [Chlamydomonas reinhardtii]|uniref:Partial AB-hydrolase lipase domain-containing protein n=1 Tax=Chlamydomonas reinhardtii TaxID=3055 RepID=A0A2K3D710_CHLRE|nr:uncharacterized protein CHLRE_12g541352v5 [Chlamydomonas reinhardtii]PNW76314.1 hypothetical protein CHLRE_12g541352v5 [Chlamydomonas reinhardtii]